MPFAITSPDRIDLLTGLPGIAAACDWLDDDPARAPAQAMLVGLKRLQSVNLAFGKTGGDEVLAAAARRIRDFADEEVGRACLVARVGGDEFLFASRAPLSRERWQWLGEALGVALARPIRLSGDGERGEVRLTPRIALLRAQAGDSATALLERLEQALAASQRGAHRLVWADGGERPRGQSAARLEADLMRAMGRGEITVLFQPQYAVADDRLIGAEALARWDHPELGRIGAETLFAVAEGADAVAQLSRHIVHTALAAAVGWAGMGAAVGAGGLRLSLNVTAADLATADFVNATREAICETGMRAQALTLEITEQTLIADFASSARALNALADEGIAIALDDFGTGFANFRTLRALPLNALKLDASLIRDIATDAKDRAILKAMLALAHTLGLKAVAEGVEDERQLKVLRDEGCDAYQGFLRSGPLAAADMAAHAIAAAG